jgi:L-fuculose-phosphate aldolase
MNLKTHAITAVLAFALGAFGVHTATQTRPQGQAAKPAAAAAGDPVRALKEKVALATKMLVREKIITSSGHVSARIPGTDKVLIGPGLVTRDLLTADDILTVDLNAKQLEGTHAIPLETEIHTGAYRARADVMAVVHGHPVHSTVFTITKKPILPVSVHGAIFADGVPTFDHVGHVNTRELGDGLAKALGTHRAALIRMHGTIVVGSSVEEVFAACLQLEENAEKQLLAHTSGPVTAMTAEEASRSVKESFGPSSIDKRWRYYKDVREMEK